MNYLKIVLDGYCNENSRNHLVDYFKREAINAKENHYNFEEFFDGCNKEVENLQKYYHYYLNKNKNGFYNVNDAARNRQTTIQEGFFEAFGFTEYSSKSYEEQCDKLIEINNEHIKGLDLNNYWQPLISLNMGYNGYLLYNDTLQISEAILSAKKHFELQELNGIFQNIIQEAAIKVTQKAVQPQPENDELITKYIPNKDSFKHLPDTNFPTIDEKIVSIEFILEKYYNKVFECSLDAFYAWLVFGKKYEAEPINWTFKKTNKTVISKAQLKMFIDKITNTNTTKVAYFNQVFGLPVKGSDYKNARLDDYFKELKNEIDKNKLKIK